MSSRRSPSHQGRVTTSADGPARRQPRRTVVWTAWLIVAGLTLAVVAPVIALLFS